MAKKDKLDLRTGHKLRRLSLAQCQTADQVFDQLQAQREEREQGADPDTPYDDRHKGPARLSSPFDGLVW